MVPSCRLAYLIATSQETNAAQNKREQTNCVVRRLIGLDSPHTERFGPLWQMTTFLSKISMEPKAGRGKKGVAKSPLGHLAIPC